MISYNIEGIPVNKLQNGIILLIFIYVCLSVYVSVYVCRAGLVTTLWCLECWLYHIWALHRLYSLSGLSVCLSVIKPIVVPVVMLRSIVFTSFQVANIVPLKSEVVFPSGKLAILRAPWLLTQKYELGNMSFRARWNAVLGQVCRFLSSLPVHSTVSFYSDVALLSFSVAPCIYNSFSWQCSVVWTDQSVYHSVFQPGFHSVFQPGFHRTQGFSQWYPRVPRDRRCSVKIKLRLTFAATRRVF